MFPAVDTTDLASVRAEVQTTYLALFPDANPSFIPSVFSWADQCFNGCYKNYLPIDAQYHDLEHTLQGTLCLTRTLAGYHQWEKENPLTRSHFELGIAAILLHDTGYLKTSDDSGGTGAKYTFVHVSRSVEFAGTLLAEKGYAPEEIVAVQNMIRCTGVNVDILGLHFRNIVEERVGHALGSADLIGQMAAPDYIDKLGVLFREFQEAVAFSGMQGRPGTFSSEKELREKTPQFWKYYVQPKLAKEFCGVHRYLGRPRPNDEHEYIGRIQANLSRLQLKLAEAA